MGHLLVDIDGVLNPLSNPYALDEGFEPVNYHWASWLLHKQHGGWLRTFRERGHRLVWATTWEDDAIAAEQYYGLDPFDEVLHFDGSVLHGETKLRAVRDYCSRYPGDVVVWLEDDVSLTLREHARGIPNLRIIQCDPSVGWTRTDLRATVNAFNML